MLFNVHSTYLQFENKTNWGRKCWNKAQCFDENTTVRFELKKVSASWVLSLLILVVKLSDEIDIISKLKLFTQIVGLFSIQLFWLTSFTETNIGTGFKV